jgi:transcriptional regulator with XRE-family HTH domain
MLRSHRLFIAARALAGLSQSELASQAGVALSVLQAIEQNRSDPKLTTILALLDVLKSKGVELLPETGQVAFGLFVTVGSEADLTGSIRPTTAPPLVPAGDPDTRGSTSRTTRSKRSTAGKPEP